MDFPDYSSNITWCLVEEELPAFKRIKIWTLYLYFGAENWLETWPGNCTSITTCCAGLNSQESGIKIVVELAGIGKGYYQEFARKLHWFGQYIPGIGRFARNSARCHGAGKLRHWFGQYIPGIARTLAGNIWYSARCSLKQGSWGIDRILSHIGHRSRNIWQDIARKLINNYLHFVKASRDYIGRTLPSHLGRLPGFADKETRGFRGFPINPNSQHLTACLRQRSAASDQARQTLRDDIIVYYLGT